MTSDRDDELNSRMNDADGTLSDNDDLHQQGKTNDATSMVQAVVDRDRWYYYHVSTP
jgi:uncharacterized protein YjbJ (UPF0337 family)